MNDGEQIGDAYHLDEQRGTEAGDHTFGADGVAVKKSQDHGKAYAYNTDVRVANKPDPNSSQQKDQGEQSQWHIQLLLVHSTYPYTICIALAQTQGKPGCRCAQYAAWGSAAL